MKSVSNFYMGRLTNAYHAAFHHAVASKLADSSADAVGLSEAFLISYQSAVELEQDVVNRTLGSAKTELLTKSDNLRDKYFRAVRNVLRNAKYTSSDSIAALYDVIQKKLLTPYPASIATENNQEESAHLRGFIFDVKKFLTAEQINLLGIKSDLDALEAANESFENVFLARVDEYVANPSGYAVRCREAVDELWEQMVRTINFYANERSNSNADIQLIAVGAGDFCDSVNELIGEVLRSVKASKAASGTGGTGNSGNSGSQDNGNSGNQGTSGGNTGGNGNSGSQDSGNSGTGGKTDGGKNDGGSTVVVGPTEATDKKEDSGASQNENGGHVSF